MQWRPSLIGREGSRLGRPIRVLYFTMVSLATSGNGGGMCCRNHVARLAGDSGIELFGMVAGTHSLKDGTDEFFSGLGVPYHFQIFRTDNIHHEANRVRSIASFAKTLIFQFPWELQALNQSHIQEGIDWAIKRYGIDALVIDYHPSALFLRLPRTDIPTVLISLNREGDFYSDQIRLGHTYHGSLTAAVSLHRARRFERHVHAVVDKVVTIGKPDLPRHKVRSPPVCITPYLDPKPDGWRYSATRAAFFVGDVNHYPNRIAVDWIVQRLAPALLNRNSDIRIEIVGAAEHQVPEDCRHANLVLHGRSSADHLARLFRTADIMICPIANDYGVKFKSLEALSYGTPLLASHQTMLGLPHLDPAHAFDLERPEAAVDMLCGLVNDPERLTALQRDQQVRQSQFIASQHGIWSRTLGTLMRMPEPHQAEPARRVDARPELSI